MPASAYFLHSHEHEEETPERHALPTVHAAAAAPVPVPPINVPEVHAPRISAAPQPAAAAKSSAPRPHFSRPATHSRDRKPAQSSSGSRTARRPGSESRNSSSRPSGARTSSGARTASAARWAANGAKSTNGKRDGARTVSSASNGSHANGNGRNHAPKGSSGVRSGKPSAAPTSQRNGHGTKPVGKSGAKVVRGGSLVRGSAPRKDARPDARASRGSRKPALAAGAKAGNSKRYGFTAPAKKDAGRTTKKRG